MGNGYELIVILDKGLWTVNGISCCLCCCVGLMEGTGLI